MLTTRRPRSRYVIPSGARRQVLLRKLLPERLWNRQVRRIFKW